MSLSGSPPAGSDPTPSCEMDRKGTLYNVKTVEMGLSLHQLHSDLFHVQKIKLFLRMFLIVNTSLTHINISFIIKKITRRLFLL